MTISIASVRVLAIISSLHTLQTMPFKRALQTALLTFPDPDNPKSCAISVTDLSVFQKALLISDSASRGMANSVNLASDIFMMRPPSN
ncbi:hypothetical protein [Rhizobium leguminosarum]|uniref:hypothetical protein n=1 Tax=Rhizobium leguminosarum TaxID=384 RepID=UPI0013EEECE6|nr:hypothetical protein [Rhizobium leguminosarum]